jgi:hypothetical protein
MINIPIGCLGVLAACAALCPATIRHVDSSLPGNRSQTGSARTPWHSLASVKLRDGDTLIIHLGEYRDTLRLRGLSDVTIRAASPGVLFNGRVTLSPDELRAVAAEPGVYSISPGSAIPQIVRVDGVLLPPRIDRSSRDLFGGFGQGSRPLRSANKGRWFYDARAKTLYFNFGAATLPRRIELVGRPVGISLDDCVNVRIYGIVLDGYYDGIRMFGGSDNVVQDCLVRSCMDGMMVRSRFAHIRRNAFIANDRHGIGGGGQRNTIDQNYFCGNGQDVYDIGRYYKAAIKLNHGSFEVISHNQILDQGHEGIWGDIDCIANLIYGNTVVAAQEGIYVEWTQRQNNITYNAIMDCGRGVTFRCSQENVVRKNWIFDHRTGDAPQESRSEESATQMTGLTLLDTTVAEGTEANVITENLIQVAGVAVSVPGRNVVLPQAVGDVGPGGRELTAAEKAAPPQFNFAPTNRLIGNLYTRPSAANHSFAEIYDKKVASLDQLKNFWGWERDAREGRFGPEAIWGEKPLWWRVPLGNRALAIPILFDGTFHLRDRGNRNDGPLGWEPTLWQDEPVVWTVYQKFNFFGSTCEGPYNRTAVLAWHSEEKAVEAIGLKPEAMPPGGMGWRSASLPVLAGDVITAALDFKTDQIVPVKPEGGAKAGLVFTDWTGTVVKSHWFPVGGEGQPRKDSTWARLKQRIPVPAGANRVQWFLGIDAASGTVAFRTVDMSVAPPQR